MRRATICSAIVGSALLSMSLSTQAFVAPNIVILMTPLDWSDFGTDAANGKTLHRPMLNYARRAADGVPQFDIERGCKVDSTATSLDTGLDETIKNCVRDERQARDQLQTQWSQFAPPDRVMCTGETTQGDGIPPSYVELLTCLQGQMLAKKLKQ